MRDFLNLPPGAGLSPMAGVTDAAFRLLCFEKGCAWAVSEMLSAKGWLFSHGKNEVERQLLERFPGEGIAGLQLFGGEPEKLGEAARQLSASAGYQFIDLNFGCPAHKIVANGEGSALMREPKRIAEIVKAVVQASALPVTVKIRAGWSRDSVNAVEVAQRAEDAGASAVAVHARTREQFYSGKADWEIIRAVKRAVKIPVFGNGDVFSAADAARMLEQTGCDRVLVGRAAQGNPWIFAEIRAAYAGKPYFAPEFSERVETALRHFDLAGRLYGPRRGLLEMRKHISWYLTGVHGAARLREKVNSLDQPDEVREFLRELSLSKNLTVFRQNASSVH